MRGTHKVRAGSILFLVLLLAQGGAAAGNSPFKLVESAASGWTYRYTPSAFPPRTIMIDGVPHRSYEGPASDGAAGMPMLPVEVLTLGVPARTSVTVELVNASYTDEPGVLVAPAPSYVRTDEGDALAVYTKDPASYARNVFVPSVTQEVEGPYTLRHARLVSIRLSPLQYNPVTKTLRRISTATLVIRRVALAGQPLARFAPAPPDPRFEAEYRGIIENAAEATAWRYVEPASIAADSTGSWFTPGLPYVRIPVARDGWYRIAPADLAALGVAAPSIDTSMVKLWYRGAQVPVYIDSEKAISFYGLRKRGDSTNIDHYTDTSAYWLSWQQSGAGLRYTPAVPPALATTDTTYASRTSVHFEENTDYYEGTGDAEVTLNGQAAGEGWAWEYFYPGTTKNHDITLDHVWRGADTTVAIVARFFSTTRNYNTPDHIARLWMNDSLIGEVSFNGRKEGKLTGSFPVRWLKEGANRLKITSIATPSSPNQFYLDWFDIEYPREHVVTGGMLSSTIAPLAGVPDRRIRVRGLPQPAVKVLDPTGGRLLTGVAVVSGGGTWSAVFADTVSVARTYLVVADTTTGVPPGMGLKTMTGLRSHPTGADYIIITHGLFRAAADRLAAHRAAYNGVRVAVVDVQDIYDEFNYGHLSSEAVKLFVKQAFDAWPSPAPADILMFGDASWDFHRYMATTIMTNFVPAYGVPAGDNWYVCFDAAHPWVPSLNIGRLTVQTPEQAGRVVDKVIGYDTYTLGDWNKNFLFISGGTTDSEKLLFNGQSDALINDVVLPAPIGGTPYRVYKATANTIDGENRPLLRSYVKEGLVFLNFLGHSGGRIWGVDIGPITDLENTNGMLPFITSVSCNVAAFAEPSNNVLSEDFVLADNRGAVAMWASSSLGYANIGASLVRYFLEHVRDDTARALGAATTACRVKLWQSRGSDYITVASMNLNPLLGDPLSSLAIPRVPDLAITPADLIPDNAMPTPLDSTTHIRMIAHNYGLVPADSVRYDLVDVSSHGVDSLMRSAAIRPTLHRDTVLIPWRGTSYIGTHQLTLTLDPQGRIQESSEGNNTAQISSYVYAHAIKLVRPLVHEVVPAGSVTLVVSAPVGGDTSISEYRFDLDTSAAFTSSFLVSSGPVAPGEVGARWVTPPLSGAQTWFWRARSVSYGVLGRAEVGSFAVDNAAVGGLPVLFRESSRPQFATGAFQGASATDSGITLAASPPLFVAARSLGYRANADRDYYSTLRIGAQSIQGYWWEQGNSFMAVRLNAFTGSYIFKPFNVSGNAALGDSMAAFLNATPVGDYILVTVIYDGYSNVGATLKSSLKSFGSALIDSVRPGHSWMLIARNVGGPPYDVKEQWSPAGVAEDSLVIPNNYAVGSGFATTVRNPFPASFGVMRWSTTATPGVHTAQRAVLGFMPSGRVDTLVRIGSQESEKDLSTLAATIRDSGYVSVALGGALSTGDALTTPVIRSWSVAISPPPDLAISPKSLGGQTRVLAKAAVVDLPIGVHNIGYQAVDSARIRVDLIRPNGTRQPLAYGVVGSIPVDGEQNLTLSIPPDGLTSYNTLEVVVLPAPGSRDLLTENNVARILVNFTSVNEPLAGTMRFFADGVPLMDGDYVSRTPDVLVQLAAVSGIRQGQERVNLFIDNTLVVPGAGGVAVEEISQAAAGDGIPYHPELPDGLHELIARLYRYNGTGGTDSIEQRLTVNVVSETRLLQVYNFPNPFSTSTEFTFVLTGARPPEELEIRIYTISGRRIHELRIPQGQLQIGFNRIAWDGRDADGDELANGVYLYQITAKGSGGEARAIEKLVKTR
ncbi:MAG: hypothetical protein IPI01_21155 [Ignavibacteriae bacterium]|nr:hypothetical protein [Ignavibacteriota bacterium]